MKDLIFRSRLSAILLSASLCVGYSGVWATEIDKHDKHTADSEKSGELASPPLGRPEVRFIVNQDIGYSIQSYKNNQINGTVIAIDGVPVRGKSKADLNHLLLGPVDSEIEVTYLNAQHEVVAGKLKRTPLTKLDGSTTTARRYMPQIISDLDYGHGLGFGGEVDQQSITRSEEQNLDLRSRAEMKRWVEEPGTPFSLTPSKLPFALVCAIVSSDKIGDLRAGDRYLQQYIKIGDYNQQFGQLWNSGVKNLFEDLGATGRKEQGEIVVDGILAAAKARIDSTRRNTEDYENCRREALKFLFKVNSAKLQPLLQEYENDHKGTTGNMFLLNESEDWRTKIVKTKGDDTAVATQYADLLRSHDISKQEKGKVDFNSALLFIHYTVATAAAQVKVGKLDDAIATDKASLETLAKMLTDEQLQLTEKTGGINVARSDIETQLADLYLQQKKYKESIELCQIARTQIENACGSKSAFLKLVLETHIAALSASGPTSKESKTLKAQLNGLSVVSQQTPSTDQELFATVRESVDVGQTKDVSKLKKKIQVLLEAYRNRDIDYDFDRPALNLFCTLMTQARMLANLSDFDGANKLLEQLKELGKREATPIALGFIDVEQAINSDWKRKSDSALWAKINEDFDAGYCELMRGAGNSTDPQVKKIRNAYATQENLRRLAVLYSSAGELLRASVLLRHAQEANEELTALGGTVKDFDSNQVKLAQIILDLDDARLKALSGDFAAANNAAHKAIALCAGATPTTREQTQSAFSQAYQCKIVELAKLFNNNDKSRSAVEPKEFLRFVLATINSGASADAPIDKDRPRMNVGYNSVIETYLAQLYFQQKDYAKALPLIRSAIDKLGKEPKFNFSMTMAEVCRATGDNAAAAKYYSKAEEWSNSINMSSGTLQRTWAKEILERAIDCAEKAPDMDKDEKANLFIRYATSLESSLEPDNFDKAVAYYQKAYDLIPDTDSHKSTLLQRMQNARNAKKNREVQTASVAAAAQTATAVSGASTTKAVNAPPTEEQQDQARANYAKDQIEGMKKKISLGEASHAKNMWTDWLQLAQYDAQVKNPGAAMEDAKKGIGLYHRSGITMRHQSLRSVLYIAIELAKQGKTVDAEQLMDAAAEKIKSIFGIDSVQYAAFMACRATLAINEKDYNKAYKFVDESLKCPARSLDLQFVDDSVLQILEQAIYYANKSDAKNISLKIWDKIIDTQKKGLSPDDIRVKESLMKRADLKGSLKDLEGELTDRQAAIAILQLYEGDLKAQRARKGMIAPLLRKMGKDTEASKLEADVIEPAGYIDPQYPQRRSRMDSVGGTVPAESLSELQAELKAAREQAPYSQRSRLAEDKLTELAVKQKEWELARDTAELQCVFYEHHNDPTAGINFGCTPETPRISYYKTLISSNVLMEKYDAALVAINRAIKNMPELSYSENIDLGYLALRCEDKALARKLAMQAEQLLPFEDYIYNFRKNSSDLWKALGDSDRADKTLAIQTEIVRVHKEQEEKVRTSPFARTGI